MKGLFLRGVSNLRRIGAGGGSRGRGLIGRNMIGALTQFISRLCENASRRRPDPALTALFDLGTAGICEIDCNTHRFLRVNQRFCEIVQRDLASLLSLGPMDLVHPDDRTTACEGWAQAMNGAGRWETELRQVYPDDQEYWVRIGASVWKRNRNGVPLRSIVVMQDITASAKVRERLRNSEELLRLGQQIGRIGSFTRDIRTGRLFSGPEAREMIGLGPSDGPLDYNGWVKALLPEDRGRIVEQINAAVERRDPEIAVEHRVVRRDDGRVRHLELRARYFYDEVGRPIRSVGVMIDVTDRKEAEDRLRHAARHDALTGLANRTLFRECLGEATARASEGEAFAVFCLDLDRFKDVNDTLGHPQGDRLLVEVAERMRQELSAGDVLARLGGDEFAIIQADLHDPEDAGRLARRLVQRLSEPFTLGGKQVTIGASIGVAVAPRDGINGEDLLNAADLALYNAKRQTARGWRYFEPQMTEDARLRRDLERDLRKALERGEFELFYQPVIALSSLRARQFEALIRWRHPERGLVLPDSFIPFCEEIGLIAPIGDWVLRRACAEAASWPAPIGVAVNISAIQAAAGDLDVVVAAALCESGLAADRLELEITETALLKDSEATLSTLRKLKALGVNIALDDFGAGHSSLGYLQSFPFDKVKIDRAFSRSVNSSAKSAAIIRSILDLCGALGISTTVEGVETNAQFQALASMGGDYVQGYLFSPPEPADRALALLEQFGGSPSMPRAAE